MVRNLDISYENSLCILKKILAVHQKAGGSFTISMDGWSYSTFKCVGFSCYFNTVYGWHHFAIELPYQGDVVTEITSTMMKPEEFDQEQKQEEEEEEDYEFDNDAKRIEFKRTGLEFKNLRVYTEDGLSELREEADFTNRELLILQEPDGNSGGDNRYAIFQKLMDCLDLVGISPDNVNFIVTDGGANYQAGSRIFIKRNNRIQLTDPTLLPELPDDVDVQERSRWIYCGLHWLQTAIWDWVRDERCNLLKQARKLCSVILKENRAFCNHRLTPEELANAGLEHEPKIIKMRSDAMPDTRWYGTFNMTKAILANEIKLKSYFNAEGPTRQGNNLDFDFRELNFDALKALHEDLKFLHRRYELLQNATWGLCSCMLNTLYEIKLRFNDKDDMFNGIYSKKVLYNRIKGKMLIDSDDIKKRRLVWIVSALLDPRYSKNVRYQCHNLGIGDEYVQGINYIYKEVLNREMYQDEQDDITYNRYLDGINTREDDKKDDTPIRKYLKIVSTIGEMQELTVRAGKYDNEEAKVKSLEHLEFQDPMKLIEKYMEGDVIRMKRLVDTFLAIPAGQDNVERSFSALKLILTKKRMSMRPKRLYELCFLRNQKKLEGILKLIKREYREEEEGEEG